MAATFLAREFATALAISVLPQPEDRRAGYAPFRAGLVLGEQIGMQVGQLDRVLDHLDLIAQTADRLVGDVGNLFEDELLDLRT